MAVTFFTQQLLFIESTEQQSLELVAGAVDRHQEEVGVVLDRVVQAVLLVNQGLDFIIEPAEQHTYGRDHNSLQQILVLGQLVLLDQVAGAGHREPWY